MGLLIGCCSNAHARPVQRYYRTKQSRRQAILVNNEMHNYLTSIVPLCRAPVFIQSSKRITTIYCPLTISRQQIEFKSNKKIQKIIYIQ